MRHEDKAIPEVEVTIAGEKRRLVCSFGAFIRFQRATGKDGMRLPFWNEATSLDLVTLVWAAMGGDACGLTVDQVADGLSAKNYAEIMEMIRVLFGASVPTDEQKKSDSPAELKPAGEKKAA